MKVGNREIMMNLKELLGSNGWWKEPSWWHWRGRNDTLMVCWWWNGMWRKVSRRL